MIHVCSLARLHETVEDTGARHVVSLIGDEASIERPVAIVPEHRDEKSIALRSASPTATPNARIVSLADRLLGRDGRMVAAIETIGRGVLATEGTPFRLDVD
jgi:predicted protein tyrosine phosphatase